MEIRPNPLREALRAGKPTLGTRIESTLPYIAEVAASSGKFEYIEFEGEYAPYTEPDLENICRACELYGCSTVVKVDRQNRYFMAQKAIACGANGILFADLYNAEEVRETLDAINPSNPGGGIFGRPNRRLGMNGSGRMPMSKYLPQVQDVVKMIMIEKADAFNDLENICKVPGVDMVVFGPFDYAMNVGWEPGERGAELTEIHKQMIEIALKNGVQPMCLLSKPEDVPFYYDLGVRHFNVGDEVDLFIDFYQNGCGKVRTLLDK